MMYRKIIAILLLFSFLGIIVHDIIPHHHHDIEFSSIQHCAISYHDNEGGHHHEHSECNKNEDLFTENHHHCPHHIHYCPIKDIKIVQLKRNKPTFRKVEVKQPFYLSNQYSQLSSLKYTTFTYIQRLVPFPKVYYNGVISLRAPPTIA